MLIVREVASSGEWAFGWTQLLTIIGFVITIVIAVGGFRTFDRWKRETIEEKRIDVAIETLALSFESKYIFDAIRSPLAAENEWKDMVRVEGESEDKRSRRGAYYAVFRRIQLNKDFFERAFKLQPVCAALLGKEADDIFMLMHRARRAIEVSAEMLAWRVVQYDEGERVENPEFYEQCRRDIWEMAGAQPEKDKVGRQLSEFQRRIEGLCRPIVDRGFKPEGTSAGSGWFRSSAKKSPRIGAL